jgi:hypothetical protein
MVIAALAIACAFVVAAAQADTRTGGTSQPGDSKITLTLVNNEVNRAVIEWEGRCGHGRTIHSRTRIENINRSSPFGFGHRFRGHFSEGRLRAKGVYTIVGKRQRSGSILGTFRLSGRFSRGKHKLGTCRTGRVHWAARGKR